MLCLFFGPTMHISNNIQITHPTVSSYMICITWSKILKHHFYLKPRSKSVFQLLITFFWNENFMTHFLLLCFFQDFFKDYCSCGAASLAFQDFQKTQSRDEFSSPSGTLSDLSAVPEVTQHPLISTGGGNSTWRKHTKAPAISTRLLDSIPVSSCSE